jgi:hypothetical protein
LKRKLFSSSSVWCNVACKYLTILVGSISIKYRIFAN